MMKACLKLKRKAKEETSFVKNGGKLLEEQIAFRSGKRNPIRIFSAEELSRATNHYDRRQCFIEAGGFEFYKGFLKDRLFSVKKYTDEQVVIKDIELECIIKDVVIGSKMSGHKNVLKLLGCCLETENPTLVYEFVGDKILSNCIYDRVQSQPIPWKCRLRIAMGIANAVAYLHTAFSRPIVHRDIQSPTIILDENNVPKLIDFSLAISIPEGQLHAEDAIRGRTGCVAPEYATTGYLTEKADVFSFGVFLLVLLAGWMLNKTDCKYSESFLIQWVKSYDEKKGQLIEIVDPALLKERVGDQQQFLAFAKLALSCICDKGEDRPTIIDAAKQLRRIYQSVSPP